MTVRLSFRARQDLYSIWLWNADQTGTEHADDYIAFLRGEVFRLGGSPNLGRPVAGTAYNRLVIRRKPGGHGHVAVYRVLESVVEIDGIFHTAQDWRSKLEDI